MTVQIEKYVWHLKNVCVVLDGQRKTAQKVHIDASYVRDNIERLYIHVYIIDVDECLSTDICHHFCTNTPGSYYCTCEDDSVLANDQSSCLG